LLPRSTALFISAMMKDTMTPGPAISLATSPDTTYIPVPTQLPTPSDTRSTVDRTRASLVPCELVPDMAESSMDSTVSNNLGKPFLLLDIPRYLTTWE
uniref:Uncharacterized protein n=1 Tax=Mola mola TaxID=94237 RepID=A0A3Q4B9Q0_MOLML